MKTRLFLLFAALVMCAVSLHAQDTPDGPGTPVPCPTEDCGPPIIIILPPIHYPIPLNRVAMLGVGADPSAIGQIEHIPQLSTPTAGSTRMHEVQRHHDKTEQHHLQRLANIAFTKPKCWRAPNTKLKPCPVGK
jgi:hypothetical protein